MNTLLLSTDKSGLQKSLYFPDYPKKPVPRSMWRLIYGGRRIAFSQKNIKVIEGEGLPTPEYFDLARWVELNYFSLVYLFTGRAPDGPYSLENFVKDAIKI